METTARVFAGRLQDAGLWNSLPEALGEAEYERVAEGGYPFATDALDDRVMFHADGESLAEFGIERFLQKLAPIVAEHGVRLDVERCRDDEWGEPPLLPYPPVVVNDQLVLFMNHDEGDSERAGETSWYLATVRPLAYLNTLLAQAGATVRFHTLNTGTEDGFALLVAPEVARLVEDSGRWSESGVPLLPVDNRPGGTAASITPRPPRTAA